MFCEPPGLSPQRQFRKISEKPGVACALWLFRLAFGSGRGVQTHTPPAPGNVGSGAAGGLLGPRHGLDTREGSAAC